jgi:hypothetical protein
VGKLEDLSSKTLLPLLRAVLALVKQTSQEEAGILPSTLTVGDNVCELITHGTPAVEVHLSVPAASNLPVPDAA